MIRDDILNNNKIAIKRRNRSRKSMKNSEMGIVDFTFKQLFCCFMFLISTLLFRMFSSNATHKISIIINDWVYEESFSIFEELMSAINNA